ncbi:hemolysin family protein [Devosia sp.]|uniref:hemolysin family protein n=1 Tax=Devosia sp. TaxID=1871048 RepID=UPI0032668802
MNDSDPTTAPKAHDTNSEPPSSPASALTRGPSIWNRLKAMLALRTVSLRDDLQVALDEQGSAETADFSESERTILQNVLKLGNISVADVMVERSDIQAVPADISLGALLARFNQAGHSRLPVYEDGLDNIQGFIHVKDVLQRISAPKPVDDPAKDVPVRLISTALKQKINKLEILRTAMFVPTSMPVGDLLQQMRASRVHMAIVVDEYGGTDGLVTIEDLLEAVVGEIEDEHDELAAALIRKVGTDTYLADARAELSDVQEMLGPDFDPGNYADDVDTIGGLVFDLAGHVPAKGEIISKLDGFDFEVLASDSRRIKRLRIRRKKKVEPQLAITDQRPADEKAAAE